MIQSKSQSENVPGVNLQAYALADDTENCFAARHCNLSIIPSPFLPPCTFLSHCLVQLVIIPSGQLCPHANLMSHPQIEVLFCLCDRLPFSTV